MKNLIFSFFLLGFILNATAQNIKDYKYVVVPESFEFTDAKNEYQLNGLTKFLLKKYGFETVMNSAQKPAVIQNNPCKALYADVINDSGLFVTKMYLVLKDCYDKEIYRSAEGRSREKDFKTAYQEALRDAFTSLENEGYVYGGELPESPENENTVEGEVAMETPQKEPTGVPQEQKNAEKPAEQQTSKNEIYVLNNTEFYLEETAEGYAFYQKGMAEPFAALIKSEKDNSYIYSAISKQGLAYFDDQGNLVIENFDKNSGKTVKTIYKLQE